MSFDEDGGTGRRRIHLREISGDSEAPLETVGQDLRAARLRRGDDLATVSRSLKIRKDHLEAVEEDNFNGLPGKTYAIGFVRSYSGYLGLDSAKIVERYKLEISGRHDEHHQITENNFHVEDQRRPHRRKRRCPMTAICHRVLPLRPPPMAAPCRRPPFRRYRRLPPSPPPVKFMARTTPIRAWCCAPAAIPK